METDARQLVADYIAAGQQKIAERAELQTMLDVFDQASPEQQRKAYETLLALAIGATIKGGGDQLIQGLTGQR